MIKIKNDSILVDLLRCHSPEQVGWLLEQPFVVEIEEFLAVFSMSISLFWVFSSLQFSTGSGIGMGMEYSSFYPLTYSPSQTQFSLGSGTGMGYS